MSKNGSLRARKRTKKALRAAAQTNRQRRRATSIALKKGHKTKESPIFAAAAAPVPASIPSLAMLSFNAGDAIDSAYTRRLVAPSWIEQAQAPMTARLSTAAAALRTGFESAAALMASWKETMVLSAGAWASRFGRTWAQGRGFVSGQVKQAVEKGRTATAGQTARLAGLAAGTASGVSSRVARRVNSLKNRSAKDHLKNAFNFATKTGSRAVVSNLARVSAVSLVAGAGASVVVTAAAAAAATGVAAGAWSYGEQTYKDYRQSLETGAAFKWVSLDRAKMAVPALLCGTIFGGAGAWLMQTDFAQAGVSWVGNRLSETLGLGGAAPVPAGPDLTPALPVSADPGAGGSAPAGQVLPVDIVPPSAVEAAAIASPQPSPALLESAPESPLSDPALSEPVVSEPAGPALTLAPGDDALAVGMAYMGLGGNAQGWALKDAAHMIVRDESLLPADRVAMARAMAEEALLKGSDQAADFIRDLARVERAWGLPVTPLPEIIDAAVPASGAQPSDALLGQVAGQCTASFNEAGGLSGVSCEIVKPVMEGGDYINFSNAADPSQSVQTATTAESLPVRTGFFLQKSIVEEGASRLSRLLTKGG